MNIGLSLASFYPLHPEDAVCKASNLGFKTAELFINTISELDDDYINNFHKLCNKHGIEINSIHPFTSALEIYMFFSRYDRRIDDSKILYNKYFNAAHKLGAKVINIHGDRGLGLKNIDEYIECIEPLLELGAKHNITPSIENVFFNSVNHPDFVIELIKKLGDSIKFTFDIKQANKGGSDPYELCSAMAGNISNFHINDYDDEHICMLPGSGCVDYNRIFKILEKNDYRGPALIEVYSDNYNCDEEIGKSADYLKRIKRAFQL